MRFRSATLKNFGSYGPSEQTLELSENGVKLLVAPNGFGKSTLFYSIVFSLYGKTNQESIDDVINRKVKKNCKTSVEFYEDGELYKVIRYRAHEEHDNNVYVFKGDRDISLRKAADTNQLILDIIKMPYQAFINSTFFSTELYSRFMMAKNSERLSVFENLLSLKEVNAYYEQAKKFRVVIKESLDNLKVSKAVKSSEIASIENNIKDYASRAREVLLELKQKKEELQNSINENLRKIAEYNSIDVTGELENNKNKSRVETLIQRKNNKENELEEFTLSLPSDKELKTIAIIDGLDIEEEKKKEQSINILKEEIKSLEENINTLKSNIYRMKSEISLKENTIKSFSKDLEKFLDEENKLDENLCLMCGQHVSSEYSSKRKEELLYQKKEITESIADINYLADNIRKELAIASEKQESIEKEVSTKKEELSKIFMNEYILSLKKPISEIVLEYSIIKKKEETFYSEKKRIDEKNKSISKELESIEAEISDINYVPKYTDEFLINIRDIITKLETENISFSNKILEMDGQATSVYDKGFVEKQKGVILTASAELSEITKEEDTVKEEDWYYSYLMNLFSNKENSFKKFFIGQMIETFNDRINQYLPFFFEEDISIVFDKELECKIIIDKEVVSIKSFSAGQKTRADLAVAFALFNLSRIFFSNESNLLIVDEILDTNIDVYGIESALTIVEGFGYDTSVFVVSHNQDIKDKIKNKIEIVRDENKFSIIK